MAIGVGENTAKLKNDLALANLERLAQHEPPSPPDGLPGGPPIWDRCNVALDLLERWRAANEGNISQAIDAQVFGGKGPISWPVAFLPFMESIAMYLRDFSLLLQAWQTYRHHKQNNSLHQGRDQALQLYHAAYNPIQQLAQSMGLEFFVLCDLIHAAPEGHPLWDGPYCGAFVSTEAQKTNPFAGIAFKGTNPLSLAQVLVDYNYQLTKANGFLQNQEVSLGVYTSMFDKYEANEDIAYDYILAAFKGCVDKIPTTGGPVRTHVTGHSLGGSYSSFCYAQMLIDAAKLVPENIQMGDEYTFGCPRVGSNDWAAMNQDIVSMNEGQSWRIVNDKDLVPQVPPTTLKPDQLNFRHVDNGWRIFSHQSPQSIPSEIGGPTPPVYQLKDWEEILKAVYQSTYHLPNFYYDALRYAMKQTQ
ncbi:lipase [Colletotrichum kahawae]|uniref:Lipase n=1 Tax=Colletotrichum kahawae TaxID=34407 RepID=A0AAD9Y7N8_COLKA|nr:lipase [Colletotrichum kahawae]